MRKLRSFHGTLRRNVLHFYQTNMSFGMIIPLQQPFFDLIFLLIIQGKSFLCTSCNNEAKMFACCAASSASSTHRTKKRIGEHVGMRQVSRYKQYLVKGMLFYIDSLELESSPTTSLICRLLPVRLVVVIDSLDTIFVSFQCHHVTEVCLNSLGKLHANLGL